MKCFTALIIVFFLSFFSLQSQSFINQTKLWSNKVGGTEEGSPSESYFIKMDGDTLLSNVNYTRVLKSMDSLQLQWYIEGFIRETDTGTVFYQDLKSQSESLLYDFGVEKQDSILVRDFDKYFNVDSIKMKPFGIYAENRKHIYLSGDYQMETWIEGVGSIYGVLSDLLFHYSVGESRSLLCFSENDSLKYNPRGTCFLTNTSFAKPSVSNDLLSVVILPDEILIKRITSVGSGVYFRIFDINGRLQYVREISGMTEMNLNTSELPSGVYIYNIQASEYIKTGKFLVD